jgi:hypothetical protein
MEEEKVKEEKVEDKDKVESEKPTRAEDKVESKTTAKPQESSEKKSKSKVKVNKTMALVVFLIALTGVLLIASLQSKVSSPFKTTGVTKEADFAHSSLAVSEQPRIDAITGNKEVDINLNSGDNKVTGAQIELTYDPKVLTDVDIKPGTFFTNPVVVGKTIDTKTGRITFMVGNEIGQQGIQGTGPVAVLSFTKTVPDETTLDLLPESLVTAQGYQSSVLKETSSAVIGEMEK